MIVSDFLLFAVFALLFCLESVIISGRGTVIIYSHLMKKWGYKVSETLPFFGARHLSLKTLFPPLGSAFITGSYPVIISPSGIMLNPYEGRWRSSGVNFFRYSDIKTIGVSGTSLVINECSFCRLHSEYEAAWWKDKLILLVKTLPDKRAELINSILAWMFDIHTIQNSASEIFKKVRPLRILVNFLYLFLFAAAPLLVFFFTFENVLVPVLTVIFLLHTAGVILFHRAYRAVFKDRGFPWSAVISIAFYPPAMIRSIDYFFKDSLIMFNSAAVSLSLMSPADSKRLISFLIREYTFFNFESDDKFEMEAADFYRESMLAEIKLLLNRNSINYSELLIPPEPDDGSEFYCPRCFCQYNGKVIRCEDCSIDLKKY